MPKPPSPAHWSLPDGPVTRGFGKYNHTGADYDIGDAGTPVHALATVLEMHVHKLRGVRFWPYDDLPAEESERSRGPVLFVKHVWDDGGQARVFWAVYGHMQPDNAVSIGSPGGTRLGELLEFREGGSDGDRADHLHVGIWLGEDYQEALKGWGYGDPRQFTDPQVFLQSHKPWVDSEAR